MEARNLIGPYDSIQVIADWIIIHDIGTGIIMDFRASLYSMILTIKHIHTPCDILYNNVNCLAAKDCRLCVNRHDIRGGTKQT